MTALPELLDADQLAERLRRDRRWVYRRAAEDGLPAIRIGRALWFDPEQVADWLEQHRTTPTTTNPGVRPFCPSTTTAAPMTAAA